MTLRDCFGFIGIEREKYRKGSGEFRKGFRSCGICSGEFKYMFYILFGEINISNIYLKEKEKKGGTP
jgi:hypothetical protein